MLPRWLTEVGDDAVKAIMADAVERLYVFLSKLFNAMYTLLEAREDEWP